MHTVATSGISVHPDHTAPTNTAHRCGTTASCAAIPVTASRSPTTISLGPSHPGTQQPKRPTSAEVPRPQRSVSEIRRSKLSPSAEPFYPSALTPRQSPFDVAGQCVAASPQSVPPAVPTMTPSEDRQAKPGMLDVKEQLAKLVSLGKEPGVLANAPGLIHAEAVCPMRKLAEAAHESAKTESTMLGQATHSVLDDAGLLDVAPETAENSFDGMHFGSFSPTMVRRLFTTGVAPRGLQLSCPSRHITPGESTALATSCMVAADAGPTAGIAPTLRGENPTLSGMLGEKGAGRCTECENESAEERREGDRDGAGERREGDMDSVGKYRMANQASAKDCTDASTGGSGVGSEDGTAEPKKDVASSVAAHGVMPLTDGTQVGEIEGAGVKLSTPGGAHEMPAPTPPYTLAEVSAPRADTRLVTGGVANSPASSTPVQVPASVSVASLCLELSPWSESSTLASPLPLALTPLACGASPADHKSIPVSSSPLPLPLTPLARCNSPAEGTSSPGSGSTLPLFLSPLGHWVSTNEGEGRLTSTHRSAPQQVAWHPRTGSPVPPLPHMLHSPAGTAVSHEKVSISPEVGMGGPSQICHGGLWQRIAGMRARFAEVQQVFSDSAAVTSPYANGS
jgi:hypothetical protein